MHKITLVTDALTLFQFSCTYCSAPNEYVHRHDDGVQPFLVSTKCSGCRRLNVLGGISGTPFQSPKPDRAKKGVANVILVQLSPRKKPES